MFDERLPTKVWVDALLRRAQVEGASAFILQRGEESRGDVIVKVADLSGSARAYVPRTSMEGTRVFVDLAALDRFCFSVSSIRVAITSCVSKSCELIK